MSHLATCLLCRLSICQSMLKSFKTLRTLTVRTSRQMSPPNKLICKILDIGVRASVTPATHWASVTLVTVQTMSIQSSDLGRLGQMLVSTGQTEPVIVLMSLVLNGEIVSNIVKLFPSDTLTQVNSLASMIIHRRSRSRSRSYDSVSLRRHSRSPSSSRGKKKKSHKKRKHSSTSSSSPLFLFFL